MGKVNRIVARQNQKTELAYYKHLFNSVKPFIQSRQMLDDAHAKGMKDGALKERANVVAHLKTLMEAGSLSLKGFDDIVALPVVDTTVNTKEVVNA